jgi:hypothetical protein
VSIDRIPQVGMGAAHASIVRAVDASARTRREKAMIVPASGGIAQAIPLG